MNAGPKTPAATERILVGGGPEPVEWVVHYDQIGVYIPAAETIPKLPATVRIGETSLELDKESDNWEDLAVYRISGGALAQADHLKTSRALQEKFPWADRAGAVIRRSGRPHVLLQQLMVVFRKDVSPQQAQALHRRLGADKVVVNRRDKHLHLVEFDDRPIIEAFRIYEASPLVRGAAPDMVIPHASHAEDSMSSLKPWHHHNDGTGGGGADVADADVDSVPAWSITPGGESVVIAVIDTGFERSHAEFRLWTNVAEQMGTAGVDDDCNGFVDDVHGWDFMHDDPDVDPDDHGTQVAGCVAAKGGNLHGISGTCPRARLMLLQAQSVASIAWAIDYAADNGADAMVLSTGWIPQGWGVSEAIAAAAATGRGNKGCLVLCAMESATGTGNIIDLEETMAVRDSSPRDTLARALIELGSSMTVLAPGKRIATTDRSRTSNPPPAYTAGFRGASAATPIHAGAVGLVLSVDGSLTRRQVQRLMQDSCDKIDPVTAAYDPATGYRKPPNMATHGYGRINAFEAVRIVAPACQGGRDGVDVFLRDQPYDWGNTEQPSNLLFDTTRSVVSHSQSPDLKLDSGPAFYMPPTTNQEFEGRAEELPQAGQPARVYLRVRNRGPRSAEGVRARLFATTAATLPPLPVNAAGDLLTSPATTAGWSLVGQECVDVEYSGCSVAGDPIADKARIVRFDWTPPAEHVTLLAVVDCPRDRLTTTESDVDRAVPRDNNLALKRFGTP